VGRLAKHTVEYFPHFTKFGTTLFLLEEKWNNDGSAFWFKLLMILGGAMDHFFDCPKETAQGRENWDYLIARARLPAEKCEEIIAWLAARGNLDNHLWKNKRIIWCQEFVNNLTEVYAHRTNPLPKRPCNGITTEEMPLQAHNHGGNGLADPISGDSTTEEGEELKAGRQAGNPPPAASFVSLLKKDLAAAGIELAPTDLDACAAKLIASSADSPAFLAFAVDKSRQAKKPATWFVKGVLEWDWIGKWRANGTTPTPAPIPQRYEPLPLHVERTPGEEAQVELMTAQRRKEMHMPLSDRQRELLGLPAPPAPEADAFPEASEEGGVGDDVF